MSGNEICEKVTRGPNIKNSYNLKMNEHIIPIYYVIMYVRKKKKNHHVVVSICRSTL